MNHIPPVIYGLIAKYLNGEATEEEKDLLNQWYHSFPENELEIVMNENEELVAYRMKLRLDESIRNDRRRTLRWTTPLRAAAVVLIAFSAVLYYFHFTSPVGDVAPVVISSAQLGNDISPGGGKAILTLADGSTIILDSASEGMVSRQGNSRIIKLGGGQLQYEVGQTGNDDALLYNHIATPVGGQYQVTLADQTKVWLNASSSIRFPAAFRGNTRDVEITGEAYFEVAPDPGKPFTVKINDAYVHVLGTHFNIMGYSNETTVNTTLLEGSLSVEKGGISKLLLPGQQARMNRTGSMDILKDIDLEEAIAWKNGKFYFNRADMPSILRQIERWYDVEIHYNGEVDFHFSGQLNRQVNVSQVLRKLELTNEVHFSIEGRKITVSP